MEDKFIEIPPGEALQVVIEEMRRYSQGSPGQQFTALRELIRP
jgi:hypothetical protein